MRNGKRGTKLKRNQPKFSIITLGCPKNLVDSEKTLAFLTERGFVFCEDQEQSDIVLVNTCGFIQEAKEESIQNILHLLELKEKGRIQYVGVIGCLPERYKDELAAEFPSLDFIAGVANPRDLSRLLIDVTELKATRVSRALDFTTSQWPRLRITPRHYAYLRISEGCNNRCSYCAIPSIRGPLRSRRMSVILNEAKELASDGVKELIVVAQDTTNYGTDRYGKKRLVELLDKLARIEEIEWIRLMYTHPAHFTKELVMFIAQCEKMCHYVDIPLQHISNRILKSMRRRTTNKKIRKLITDIRDEIPGVFIRTSFIVGYPGETRKEFSELYNFAREMKFERMGAFAYSQEEGTRASTLPRQVSERTKKRRLENLLLLEQDIVFECNENLIGRKLPVIIDFAGPKRDKLWIGRTYGDAPDVDCRIFVRGKNLKPGDIISVTVTDFENYDLIGKADV